MARFGLWWVKWNDPTYVSRMSGSLEEFRELGFDYAVVLQYTGNRRGICINYSNFSPF